MDRSDGFDMHRACLRAMAYRMLGSLSEADDALQDTWRRLRRADAKAIDNRGALLTSVGARVSRNMPRARAARREDLLVPIPDPIVDPSAGSDHEHEARMADSVDLALVIVLETLSSGERLASSHTTRLASHTTRSTRSATDLPRGDAAACEPRAEAVASQAQACSWLDLVIHPVLVNGAVGTTAILDGRPFPVGATPVRGGKIVELDFLADPARLARFDLSRLDL